MECIESNFTSQNLDGTGGSASADCEGLRIFDVAVNDSVVLDDLDIWAESGHDGACKKVVYAIVKGGLLKIHFPGSESGAGFDFWYCYCFCQFGFGNRLYFPHQTGIGRRQVKK